MQTIIKLEKFIKSQNNKYVKLKYFFDVKKNVKNETKF